MNSVRTRNMSSWEYINKITLLHQVGSSNYFMRKMHGQTTLKLPVSIPLSCSEQITTYSTCGRERSNARSIRHWLRQFKEGGGREKKNMDSRKGSRTLLYTLNHDRKCVAGVQNSQGAYHQNYDVQTSRIYKYYFEGTLEKRIFSKLWNNVFSDKNF